MVMVMPAAHPCWREEAALARLARGGIDGQQHDSGRQSSGGAACPCDAEMATQLVGVVRQRWRWLDGGGRAATTGRYNVNSNQTCEIYIVKQVV